MNYIPMTTDALSLSIRIIATLDVEINNVMYPNKQSSITKRFGKKSILFRFSPLI